MYSKYGKTIDVVTMAITNLELADHNPSVSLAWKSWIGTPSKISGLTTLAHKSYLWAVWIKQKWLYTFISNRTWLIIGHLAIVIATVITSSTGCLSKYAQFSHFPYNHAHSWNFHENKWIIHKYGFYLLERCKKTRRRNGMTIEYQFINFCQYFNLKVGLSGQVGGHIWAGHQ